MIGLVVMTHGQLGQALLDAAAMIVGPQQRVRAVALDRTSSLDSARAELAEAVAAVGRDSRGVLIMIDMFGGTPSNLCAPLLKQEDVEVLCGVNLPMVLKFCSTRSGIPLAELSRLLKGYGQQGILLVSDLLQPRPNI